MKKSYFPQEGIWLKGNLHSHSTVSDGIIEPGELAQLYREKGYHFLSMTDHNLFVSHDGESDENLILLTGVEHDLEYSRYKCIHVVGIGQPDKEQTDYVCKRYSPQELTDQQLLDTMAADGQFVVIAHPVWSRMELDEVMALNGYCAIEVYNNGTEHLCHNGNAEIYWDILLRHGKKVLAMACDDVHTHIDLFGGWIHVKAKELSKQAIVQALFEGAYYSTCGPEIYEYGLQGNQVYVACSPCREIHFVSYPEKGASFFAKDGEPISSASYPLDGQHAYVRVVCVDMAGHAAWSNPIYFDHRK